MESEELTSKMKSRIVKKQSLDYVPDPRGLGHAIYHSMLQNRDAIAQIDAESGESDTYGSLLRRCIRTSRHLLLKGVTKDDIICQCSSNHLNSCVPIISALFLGLRVTNLDPSLSVDDTTNLLNQVQPRIIFVSSDALELIERALNDVGLDCEIVLFGDNDHYTEFESFLEPLDCDPKLAHVPINNVQETAVILFSSGTTGTPKGICLNHYTLMVQIVNIATCWNLGKKLYFVNYEKNGSVNGFSVVMCFATLFWISALEILLASIMTGTTRIICSGFNASMAWKLIDKYNVEFMICPTSQAIKLYKNETPEGAKGKCLRMLVATGTSLTKTNLLELRKKFPYCFITNVYEILEVGGTICMYNFSKPADIRDQYQKPTSCGKFLPEVTYKIVDPITEKLLSVNQPGELRYKTDVFMNEYFKSESPRSVIFDNEGYVKSGNIACCDERHCIFILDTCADVFRYKNSHVIPSVIENVVKLHPAVKEAVVFGMPHDDEKIGHYAMAVVTLNKGMKDKATDEDIQTYANSILNQNQRIRAGLEILRKMPLTLDGRPKREKVKNIILKGEYVPATPASSTRFSFGYAII